MENLDHYVTDKNYLNEILHLNLKPKFGVNFFLLVVMFKRYNNNAKLFGFIAWMVYVVIYLMYVLLTMNEDTSRFMYFTGKMIYPDIAILKPYQESIFNFGIAVQYFIVYPLIAYILPFILDTIFYIYKTNRKNFFCKDAIATNFLGLGMFDEEEDCFLFYSWFIFNQFRKSEYSCVDEKIMTEPSQNVLKLLDKKYKKFSQNIVTNNSRGNFSLNLNIEDLSYFSKIISALSVYAELDKEHKTKIAEQEFEVSSKKKKEEKEILLSSLDNKKKF